jgi:hypothetical protein
MRLAWPKKPEFFAVEYSHRQKAECEAQDRGRQCSPPRTYALSRWGLTSGKNKKFIKKPGIPE